MIQRAYKYMYVSSSLWPRLMFSEPKITNISKSNGRELGKGNLPREQFFYTHRSVSCRTISIPSFNDLRCKLAKIALFIYLI